jgi:hypothetical protein
VYSSTMRLSSWTSLRRDIAKQVHKQKFVHDVYHVPLLHNTNIDIVMDKDKNTEMDMDRHRHGHGHVHEQEYERLYVLYIDEHVPYVNTNTS